MFKSLPCEEDYLNTSFLAPGTKLLGCGGDNNEFNVVEATSWHAVKRLTCEAFVYASFISPNIKHLGYDGDDKVFTAAQAAGWQVAMSLTHETCFNASFFSPDTKLLSYGGACELLPHCKGCLRRGSKGWLASPL